MAEFLDGLDKDERLVIIGHGVMILWIAAISNNNDQNSTVKIDLHRN